MLAQHWSVLFPEGDGETVVLAIGEELGLCCLDRVGIGSLSVTDAKPYRHRFQR